MYSLVVILMVLVCFNFVLKQSWHNGGRCWLMPQLPRFSPD